ncbi:MAG: PQQ-binding-like beta-propeller repeat protein [Planctomycetota bacterium]|nr:PQQ-binding-like beta-propeller repeat protein [Planctomycetota bacterium]
MAVRTHSFLTACVLILVAQPILATVPNDVVSSLQQESALCVVLDVGDGTTAVQLSAGGKHLVHGLCATDASLSASRARIEKADLLGVVTVERRVGKKLSYADHLVNLVVVHDWTAFGDTATLQEIVRVLQPGGVAWLGNVPANETPDVIKELGGAVSSAKLSNGWLRVTKQRPEGFDTWTHTRHDASYNPVSRDTVAGVPSGIRWVAGPNWPTGYRKSSVHAVAATEKRLVYVFEDEVETPEGTRRVNSLISRDAFNGMRQWRRQADSDELVAVGRDVFTVVGRELVRIDADTGHVALKFSGLASPKKFIHVDGKLIVQHEGGLSAVDPGTGTVAWTHKAVPVSFLAGDGRLFLQVSRERTAIECLDIKTGKPVWSTPIKGGSRISGSLILLDSTALVCAASKGNFALSAKDGSQLWEYSYKLIGHGGSYSKVLAMNDLVWIHTADSQDSKQYAWEGLDPLTGKVQKRIVQPKEFGMKHRCSYDVATDRYFMCGSMDFADLASGQYKHFSAGRNSCRSAGLIPANGMIYTFPHACGCYPMLRGFLGFECVDHAGGSPAKAVSAEERLQAGPAYDLPLGIPQLSSGDWPMYRLDANRRGSTAAPGPARLDRLWTSDVSADHGKTLGEDWTFKNGGSVSAPVVAGGLAFVAATDEHRLFAYDAATGEIRWTFTAGGRLDCPPTIHEGMCLFGSRDGHIYCVRAADGELAWRFLAAPVDRRVPAYGQLESPWPVVGGVLVYDGLAYCVAGRHTGADGGLFVSAVQPQTGKLVWSGQVEDFDGVADILTGGNGTVQMASWTVNAKTGGKPASSDQRLRGGRLGLLNAEWYLRPIAMRKNLQQWTVGDRPRGQMLSFNAESTCGYLACSNVSGGDGVMSGNAVLFGSGPTDSAKWKLNMSLHTRVYAMAMAVDRLYVAGKFFDGEADKQGHFAARIYSVAGGKLLDEFQLTGQPVHDGLAVARERVYIGLDNGQLVCLGAGQRATQ